MATVLPVQSGNKFHSKLIDKRFKNKHRDENYTYYDRRPAKFIKQWLSANLIIEQGDLVIDNHIDDTYIPIWECPLCTYINIEQLSFCSMCNNPLNFNYYSNQPQVSNDECQLETLLIQKMTRNKPKNKRKSKRTRSKQSDNHFKSYWESASEFAAEHSKLAIKNRRRIRKYQRKQNRAIQQRESIKFGQLKFVTKGYDTENVGTLKGKFKLNVLLRLGRSYDISDKINGIQRYNNKHPQNRINIKDYHVLYGIVSIRDAQTNRIIKSIKTAPDYRNYYLPIYSVESGIEHTEDLPIVNADFNRTYRMSYYRRYMRYTKLDNTLLMKTVSRCADAAFLKSHTGSLSLGYNVSTCDTRWKYAPVTTDLIQVLIQFIPQWDILYNILIPYVGNRWYCHISMESSAIDPFHFQDDGNQDVNVRLSHLMDGPTRFESIPRTMSMSKRKNINQKFKPHKHNINNQNAETYHCAWCRWHKENHQCWRYLDQCNWCRRVLGCKICEPQKANGFCKATSCKQLYEYHGHSIRKTCYCRSGFQWPHRA